MNPADAVKAVMRYATQEAVRHFADGLFAAAHYRFDEAKESFGNAQRIADAVSAWEASR